MKVAESGYKLDLHIHSSHSKTKDGMKVAFNTIENINVLITRLNDNNVQLCSITDHDAFGYDLYKELKKQEDLEASTIVKVFPGVEFSVEFQGDETPTVVHVIAIFDDSNDEKLARISSIITGADGKPLYDREMAFSEERFISILRDIELDTVLIAHQKESLTTKSKPRKSDANSVGERRFREFVYTEFFEAFEFKNKRNEIFHKFYLEKTGTEEDIRFITGSDCHDWRVYPKETMSDKSEFVYTYIKCLPTFRGLVMAITDHRRIKRVNSFFNVAETYLQEIKLSIDGKDVSIPMSRGINVIIGDNSIGKSLLLHKLTGYVKQQNGGISRQLVNSYNRYLKENRIKVLTTLDDGMLFGFDMQGEVRSKFEEEKPNSDEYLKRFYPDEVDSAPYREIIQRQLDYIYSYLEEKFELDKLEDELGNIVIEDYSGISAESMSFVGCPQKNNKLSSGYGGVRNDTLSIIEQVNTLFENKWLDENDREDIRIIRNLLVSFAEKFKKKKSNIDLENKRIGAFQYAVSSFKQRYTVTNSDMHKKMSAYNERMDSAKEKIIELVRRREANRVPEIYIKPMEIVVNENRVYSYVFNSRLNIIKIDTEYFWGLFTRALKKDNHVSVLNMSREQLKDAIPYYDGPEADVLDILKSKIEEILDEDLKHKYTITQHGMDKTRELSAGFNAQIYFDLISYADDKNGVYIIDQPEDNIAQKAIREYLLARFKTMGERRQVIIVTHNPQFIVNLDVDNVIYLGRDASGRPQVQSGALEYKCPDYNILEIISNHIEGGLDTLQRRWKRYEKGNRV